jgi:hypothetical protein
MSREPFGVRPLGLVARCWGSGEVPPLAVVLSPSLSLDLTESRVNAVTINRIQWGARLVLTVALLYFLSWRSSWIYWGPGTMPI